MLVLLAGYFHSAPLSANILVGPPSGSILLAAVRAGGWHTVMRGGHDCVRVRVLRIPHGVHAELHMQ